MTTTRDPHDVGDDAAGQGDDEELVPAHQRVRFAPPAAQSEEAGDLLDDEDARRDGEEPEPVARTDGGFLPPPDRTVRVAGRIKDPYRRVMRNYRELDEALRFSELKSIQALRDTWEARGIGPSDPVWLLVETLSLFEARMRQVQQTDAELTASLADQMQDLKTECASGEKEMKELRAEVNELRSLLPQVTAILRTFAQHAPVMAETMATAADQINEKSGFALAMQIAIPAATTLCGVIIGQWAAGAAGILHIIIPVIFSLIGAFIGARFIRRS